MKRFALLFAFLAVLAVPVAPTPIHAAATVAQQDPDGNYVPCSCLCIPWFNGTKICVCACAS